MKKIIGIITCALLVVGLAACGGGSSSSDSKVVVGGSTSIQPLMDQIAEEYSKAGNGTIEVQGGGSSVGTKGTIDGTFTVGMASRALKDDEAAKLDSTVIALDGIAIIVNDKNSVKDITLDQAKKIFTGEIKNWKELGGADKEISVVSREEGSGTRDGFESIVGFETKDLIATASVQNATGAVISSVSGNENAIGYISMGSLSSEVKALSVEGVAPTDQAVTDKSYKLQRPFTLCVKKGSKDGEKLYDFIFSDAGKKIIQDHHYIPVER